MIQIPDFKDKAQLFAYLRANKHLLITAKKSAIKYADAIMFSPFVTDSTGKIEKAVANIELLNTNEFPVDIVINTTYIRDSHNDVHIDGIWKKSISERKMIYHLQEHEMRFDKVISDTVKASTRKITWAELCENYEGSTEALVFHSTIMKERNPFMFEQYARGYVKNHSVGMQYVKIDLAMNSESKYDQDEKAVWDKYIYKIANREEVEADGYFWAVTEAKLIEGSAVLIGSNRVTPTINIGEAPKALNTADEVTDTEPLNWGALAEAFKSKSN